MCGISIPDVGAPRSNEWSGRQENDGERSAHVFFLDLGTVMRPPRQDTTERRQNCGCDEDCEDRKVDQASFGHGVTSFHDLEADVL